MIRMSMGDDDQVYLFGCEVQVLKPGADIVKKMNMPRINQNRFGPLDQIGVAIIRLGVAPNKGMEVIGNFHQDLFIKTVPSDPGMVSSFFFSWEAGEGKEKGLKSRVPVGWVPWARGQGVPDKPALKFLTGPFWVLAVPPTENPWKSFLLFLSGKRSQGFRP